jgi:hypothetical protein
MIPARVQRHATNEGHSEDSGFLFGSHLELFDQCHLTGLIGVEDSVSNTTAFCGFNIA